MPGEDGPRGRPHTRNPLDRDGELHDKRGTHPLPVHRRHHHVRAMRAEPLRCHGQLVLAGPGHLGGVGEIAAVRMPRMGAAGRGGRVEADQDPRARHRSAGRVRRELDGEVTRLPHCEGRWVAEQLHPVALHPDGAGDAERPGAVVASVGGGPARQQDDEQSGQEPGDHRPYFRSISALTSAIDRPAFTMRDASSASSMQTSHVAAWPSV